MATRKQYVLMHGQLAEHCNCSFMFSLDDFRMINPRKWGYRSVTTGSYKRREKLFVGDNGKTYKVWPDWSVREVRAS